MDDITLIVIPDGASAVRLLHNLWLCSVLCGRLQLMAALRMWAPVCDLKVLIVEAISEQLSLKQPAGSFGHRSENRLPVDH